MIAWCSERHSSVITANSLMKERTECPQGQVGRTEPESADQIDDVIVSFQTEQSAKEDIAKKSEALCVVEVCCKVPLWSCFFR